MTEAATIGVLRSLVKFTRKHLCQSLFLIKLQAFSENTFFTEHSGWLFLLRIIFALIEILLLFNIWLSYSVALIRRVYGLKCLFECQCAMKYPDILRIAVSLAILFSLVFDWLSISRSSRPGVFCIKKVFLIFFLSGFSFTNIHDSRNSRERGRLSLPSSLLLPPASQTLRR